MCCPRPQVCYACVEEGEFRLAQLCGLNIIINADDLEEVLRHFDTREFNQRIQNCCDVVRTQNLLSRISSRDLLF